MAFVDIFEQNLEEVGRLYVMAEGFDFGADVWRDYFVSYWINTTILHKFLIVLRRAVDQALDNFQKGQVVPPAAGDHGLRWDQMMLYQVDVKLPYPITKPLLVRGLPQVDVCDFGMVAVEAEENMVHELLVLCFQHKPVVLQDVYDAFTCSFYDCITWLLKHSFSKVFAISVRR